MSRYFPLFIDLEQKRVLVVGAGTIATRRIQTLLDFGPWLTVAAPEASEAVRQLAEEGRLELLSCSYREELLAGQSLVLAATNDDALNHQIAADCRARGIPVNAASDRKACDFYFPGIASEGDLVAGVTAGGTDHRLARTVTERIRQLLQDAVKNR